ncbi:prolyl oligopeptidase family serine peptidase [Pedobacter nyackensis]|uniref:S9 family peptidase n=1 Tax=Pedobacter nyackensis TaxID=475255 RepID=UPI002931768B|nr:prolyl oligopeptidase family serine peptidase [Pedobacter nyackensis]
MRQFFLFSCLLISSAKAQQLAPLTVEKIMRDQKWIGVSPSGYRWAADSKTVYFDWNQEGKEKSELYGLDVYSGKLKKEDRKLADKAVGLAYRYNADRTLGVAEKEGDLYFYDVKSKKNIRLTNTSDYESNPYFLRNGCVVFQRGENVFELDFKTSELKQLTNFIRGVKPASDKDLSDPQGAWLKKQQTELFDIIRGQKKEQDLLKLKEGKRDSTQIAKEIFIGDKELGDVVVSPDGGYISYKLSTGAEIKKNTIVPNYVTASGYTKNLATRTKVGSSFAISENHVYDVRKDTVYVVRIDGIPGVKDLPDYVKDYPAELDLRKQKNADRGIDLAGPYWNEKGTAAVMIALAQDNKDLWLLKLDAATGKMVCIDRQRDEAWIGGPGVGELGWLDADRVYYRSEASGYAHIYSVNVSTGEKKQLTSGNWEVQELQLSKDKKWFYFKANKVHPGVTHFYKLGVNGGGLEQLTTMKGGNDVLLSPDEKWLALNYSYMNKPWELYLQANKPGAKALKITSSTSKEFNSYPWREPDMVVFKNRYGDDVYARVYPASTPHPNRPAVVFVHGAGYLQNVHYWWSQYSREYMFNNLLADNGYTVIDIDYTASSGYGRNHRTGIYRHMGGKDLTDQVDGVKMLVDKYGVNPKYVGLYGGSYGGFITLMALFKEGDVFKSGAALRSVTDWAHYNQGYTSNILNEPFNDEKAYKQSSPIYFAEGFKGSLLMCHGMVDVNVHFQDVVRLSQRLIELGKDNWELAVYPVEDHGFIVPSSWTDEYKRVYKLFEETLKNP